MTVEQNYLREIPASTEKEQGFEFYLSILRRRWAFFLIPFVAALCVSAAVALLMSPIFHSEARILVQTQQIPSDLVRSTVTATAEERIQVIAQRIMTRDNLMAIVNKFQMFPKWRSSMSDSDIVELMRERATINPVVLNIAGSSNRNASALAFTIGFDYEDPQTTMRVANELVTLILNEDVRSRTSRASETTKFLGEEVDRLENERLKIEAQLAELRTKGVGAEETAGLLAALKATLLQKSTIYSDSHPEIRALKERIKTLEQAGIQATPQQVQEAASAISKEDSASGAPAAVGEKAADPLKGAAPQTTSETTTIGLLQAKEKSVQEDLDKAREKLLAANQGQRLEEDQQSERFEVIEQPALPQEPIKPNRKKLLAMGFALSVVAGFGGVFGIESYDKTIRGTTDLPMPPRLVVTIPYIMTHAEAARSKRRLKIAAMGVVTIIILLLVIVHFFVLPLDLLFEKLTDRVVGA